MRFRLPFLIIAFVLLIPWALLLNLGDHHLFVHTDESRRALVSMEMFFNQNFWLPTINGESYLNKPALYSWWVSLFYYLFGDFSELSLRYSTVIALLAFLFIIGLFTKKEKGNMYALLVVACVLTNSRTLFYDSFLGMIDFPFSILAYASMMSLYSIGNHGSLRIAFIVSYLLGGFAFLVKGMPAAAFTGINTIVYLCMCRKQWRKLFSVDHFIGILIFAMTVLIYYGHYHLRSSMSIETIVSTIFTEASKRTVVRFGIWNTIKHIFIFPIDTFINFLPWTLPLVSLASKEVRKQVLTGKYEFYCLATLLGNLIVYWTSPEVTPRYLHTLTPFVFSLSISCTQAMSQIRYKWLKTSFLVLSSILCFAIVAVPYYEAGRNAPETIGFGPIVLCLIGLSFFKTIIKGRTQHSVLAFACIILITRVCYDVYLLPQRAYDREHLRKQAIEVGQITYGKPLYLFHTWLQDGSTFYIARERQEVLRITKHWCHSCFLIISRKELEKHPSLKSIKQIQTLFQDEALHLVWINSKEKIL